MRATGFVFVASGVLLHAYTAFAKAENDAAFVYMFSLMMWSCLPYFIPAALLLSMERATVPACGAAVPLAIDVWVYYVVFVHSTSSTAGLTLLFAPFWNLVLYMPIGIGLGWVVVGVQTVLANHRRIEQLRRNARYPPRYRMNPGPARTDAENPESSSADNAKNE